MAKGIAAKVFLDGEKEFRSAVTSINKSVNAMKTELQAVSSSFGKNNQTIEAYTAKNQSAKKVLDALNDRLKAQKEALAAATEEYGEAGDKTLEWQTSVNRTQNEINKFTNQIEDNESAIKDLQKELEETAKETDDLEEETKELNSAMNKGEDASEKYSRKIDAMSVALGALAAKAISEAISKIKDLGMYAVNAGIEFGSAFAGVKKTVDGTPEELENINQEIRNMATELPATAVEIAAVAESAGQLGIKTENITSFSRTIIDLGESSNLAGEEGATMLAKFANITRMDQGKFSNLASSIVALGNSAATTEKDIANMAMNLASAGSQVGMSEADILALATALSSVGMEAQAGGTAFSKVMIEMQLASEKGGTELEEFAKVAGMSASDFAHAFKTDATGALLSFIKGLSNAGEEGQTAIKILDNMGITEVRLRDALLRSANASDIFSDSIALSSQAFEENTALQNEANQRYETTESQLAMAKNSANDLAITYGQKLSPKIRDVAKDFSRWAKSNEGKKAVEDIADATGVLLDGVVGVSKVVLPNLKNISIAIAGVTLAIRANKEDTLTNTVVQSASNTLSALRAGTLATETGATIAQTAATKALNLAKAATPWGLAIAGATALVAATVGVVEAITKEDEAHRENIERMDEVVAKQQELDEARNEMLESGIGELNHVQSLKEELDGLASKTGELTQSEQDRARFIIGELNGSLGTELELNQLLDGSYKDQMANIDNLIVKKRGQLMLEALEPEYKEAIINLTKEQIELDKIKMQLSDMEVEKARLEALIMGDISDEKRQQYQNERKELSDKTKNLNEEYDKQNEIVEGYYSDISTYQEAATLMASENAEDWAKAEKLISTAQMDTTENMESNLEQQRRVKQEFINWMMKEQETHGDERYKQQLEQAQRELEQLDIQINEQTSTVKKSIPEYMETWKKYNSTSIKAIKDSSPELYMAALEQAQMAVNGAESKKEAYAELGKMFGEDFVTELKNKYPEANEAGDSMAETTVDGMASHEADAAAAGTGTGESYVEGVDEKQAIAEGSGNFLAKKMLLGISTITKNASTGSMALGADAGLGFGVGVKNENGYVFGTGNSLGHNFTSGLGTSANYHSLFSLGGLAVNGFVDSADAKKQATFVSGSGAGRSMTAGMSSQANYNSGWGIGDNTGEGFAIGMQNKNNRVYSVASTLANTAILALKKTLDVHSPSRKAEEIGMYTGEGFGNGIDNLESDVYQKSVNLAKVAMKGLATANQMQLPSITDTLEYDINFVNQRMANTATRYTLDEEEVAARVTKAITNQLHGASIKMDKREFGKLVMEAM